VRLRFEKNERNTRNAAPRRERESEERKQRVMCITLPVVSSSEGASTVFFTPNKRFIIYNNKMHQQTFFLPLWSLFLSFLGKKNKKRGVPSCFVVAGTFRHSFWERQRFFFLSTPQRVFFFFLPFFRGRTTTSWTWGKRRFLGFRGREATQHARDAKREKNKKERKKNTFSSLYNTHITKSQCLSRN